MYQVVLTSTARKSLKKIDRRYISALDKAMDRLAHNPKLGSPLVGSLKGLWKLRFSRYRIIYTIHQQQLIIVVLDVRHRKDAY